MTERPTVVRTTNKNGTYRYALNGDVIAKGTNRRYEAAAIYRAEDGTVYASLHMRADLARKGNRNYKAAPSFAVAIIDGDAHAAPAAPAAPAPTHGHNPATCTTANCTMPATGRYAA